MIDLRELRENPEPYRASQRARGADTDLVDRIIAADESRRSLLGAFEALRAEQKSMSKAIGKASPGAERDAALASAKELAERVKAAEAAANAAAAELDDLARQFPQFVRGALNRDLSSASREQVHRRIRVVLLHARRTIRHTVLQRASGSDTPRGNPVTHG